MRVFRLSVTLQDVQPRVWRQIDLSPELSLAQLHGIIQAAFGWQDYHLHEFEAGGLRYGDPTQADGELDLRDERLVSLAEMLRKPGDGFRYDYDLGDGWEHTVVLDGVLEPDPAVRYPHCVAGGNACPPEDCGGPDGYAELCEAMADPAHPERAALIHWLGGEFDPEQFSLSKVNRALTRVTRRRRA